MWQLGVITAVTCQQPVTQLIFTADLSVEVTTETLASETGRELDIQPGSSNRTSKSADDKSPLPPRVSRNARPQLWFDHAAVVTSPFAQCWPVGCCQAAHPLNKRLFWKHFSRTNVWNHIWWQDLGDLYLYSTGSFIFIIFHMLL